MLSPLTNRALLFAAILVTLAACSSSDATTPSGYTPTTDVSDLCQTPLAPNEPLCSTAFSDALWAASHRSSYAQGSSAFAGPTDASTTTDLVRFQATAFWINPITLL